MKYFLATVFACSISANALAGSVMLDINAGIASAEISDADVYGNTAGDHDGVSWNAYVGYQFDAGLYSELGVGHYSADLLEGLLDTVDIKTVEAVVGYTFKWNSFFLRPAAGVTHWDVSVEEGDFFGAGSGFSAEEDGVDASLSIAAGYKFNDTFGVSLGYWMLDVPFGSLDATYLALNFNF